MTKNVFTSGKIAVITGAALGIGRAASTAFASKGMKLCIVDLASDDFDAAVAHVKAAAGSPDDIMAFQGDVADPSQMGKTQRSRLCPFRRRRCFDE